MNLKSVIAPSFYEVHKDIKQHKHTHYWICGGRGSTKSSFIAIELILGIMKDPNANCVALRKVKETLHDSVYDQLCWAIDILGVDNYWDKKKSPLTLTYTPTGQQIRFRGADNPKKIKSTKFRKGYCKFIWYEELDEFNGMEEIRMINQSLMRGGEKFIVLYSYNPPKSQSNWVNAEVQLTRKDRLTHHSNYLSVPKEWLGEQFITEAEHLKAVNEKSYNHEYLGEVTGTGGEVFTNVKQKSISDTEIKEMVNKRRGIDFGYAIDPATYIVGDYDRKYKRLTIFHEVYKVNLSNKALYDEVVKENKNNELVIADSAEPKSIAELKQYGMRVKGVKKGPDSVEYGVKFLSETIEEIIIDSERCPNTYREFTTYELEKDSNGNFKAGYPDKNNHTIDAVRYALSDDIRMHQEEQKQETAEERRYRHMVDTVTGGEIDNSIFKWG